MSTDKTLADVQPGGRVRLGDALLPCPFCGNDAEFVPYKNNGLTLKCKSMGCIQRHQRTLRYGIEWLRTSMTEHWNARALSAHQPVDPERGHIDPSWSLHDRVEFALRDAGFDLDEAAFVAEAADRARQPVELIAQKVGDYRVTVAEDAITVSRGRDIVFACRAGDPEPINASQPVGEPFAYGSSAGHQPIPASVYYPDNEACRELYDIPLYAAPPAQAVDLGQFRPAVECWRWTKAVAVNSGELDTEMKRSALFEVNEADRLLALIDSQAVGNK